MYDELISPGSRHPERAGGGGAIVLLTITRSSTDVVITWTNTAIGWLLEQSTNLVSPIAWSPNTNAILNTNGNFNVIVPAGEGNRFYHLKK